MGRSQEFPRRWFSLERRRWLAAALLVVALVLTVAFVQTGAVSTPWTHEQATVTFVDPAGGERITVDAEVADTTYQRFVGLSDHDELAANEGMLFVHAWEAERTYVMRGMDFDVDIVFVDADGGISTIHEARAPPPGESGLDRRYSGDARWVIELPDGTAEAADLQAGDEVQVEYVE